MTFHAVRVEGIFKCVNQARLSGKRFPHHLVKFDTGDQRVGGTFSLLINAPLYATKMLPVSLRCPGNQSLNIILAVLFFGGIWGLWGVFFAIPLATLIKAILNAWPRTQEEAEASEAT